MALIKPFYRKIRLVLVLGLLSPHLDTALADSSTDELMADALRSYDRGDYGTAFELWATASDRGNSVAMVALANMHLQGEGRPKSARHAVSWYRKAALKGETIAQVNYGDLLLRGVGVGRNVIQAYAWLKLAGDKGNQWALDQYLKIENSFTADQRDAALATYLKVRETQK